MSSSHESIVDLLPTNNVAQINRAGIPKSQIRQLIERLSYHPNPDIVESLQNPPTAHPLTDRISRRTFIKLATTVVVAGGSVGLGLWNASAYGSETEKIELSSDGTKNYQTITGAVEIGFNHAQGPVIGPNIQRFNKPDGLTPSGDPRWTLDTNLSNPDYEPANRLEPPKLFVVLKKDGVTLSTNVASLFPELSNPESVTGEDLIKIIKTLCDKPEQYQVRIVDRVGSGDDGAGDDIKTVANAIRNIDGKLVNVGVNSVGSFTMVVPNEIINNK